MVGTKSLVAAVAAVLCLCGVASALRHITSMDDFFQFADDIVNMKLKEDVVLDTDLDFFNASLDVPVGVAHGQCTALSQNFDGNGHVVKNLKMKNTATGADGGAALFCTVFFSTVENLVFDDSCEFIGSTAAAVAVSGVSPVFNNITVNAKVTGWSIAAGFVGDLSDPNFTFLPPSVTSFENCENNAVIETVSNDKTYVGGFIGYMNYDRTSSQFSVNFENNYGKYDIYPQSPNSVLGDLIGSMEKSENGSLNLKGNKFSATSHSGQCKELYSGGLIGRILSCPNFAIDMEDNSYHHIDKNN